MSVTVTVAGSLSTSVSFVPCLRLNVFFASLAETIRGAAFGVGVVRASGVAAGAGAGGFTPPAA